LFNYIDHTLGIALDITTQVARSSQIEGCFNLNGEPTVTSAHTKGGYYETVTSHGQ
jgi:hypothetical protein